MADGTRLAQLDYQHQPHLDSIASTLLALVDSTSALRRGFTTLASSLAESQLLLHEMLNLLPPLTHQAQSHAEPKGFLDSTEIHTIGAIVEAEVFDEMLQTTSEETWLFGDNDDTEFIANEDKAIESQETLLHKLKGGNMICVKSPFSIAGHYRNQIWSTSFAMRDDHGAAYTAQFDGGGAENQLALTHVYCDDSIGEYTPRATLIGFDPGGSYSQAGFDMKAVFLHIKLIAQASVDEYPAMVTPEVSNDAVPGSVFQLTFACNYSISWPAMSSAMDSASMCYKKIQIFEKKGVDENRGLCVVTKLLDSGSVSELLMRDRKLQKKEIVRIATDFAEAIKFVNDHDVLLDRHGNACFGDMGIITTCKILGGAVESTTDGYRWLAPEIIAGDPKSGYLLSTKDPFIDLMGRLAQNAYMVSSKAGTLLDTYEKLVEFPFMLQVFAKYPTRKASANILFRNALSHKCWQPTAFFQSKPFDPGISLPANMLIASTLGVAFVPTVTTDFFLQPILEFNSYEAHKETDLFLGTAIVDLSAAGFFVFVAMWPWGLLGSAYAGFDMGRKIEEPSLWCIVDVEVNFDETCSLLFPNIAVLIDADDPYIFRLLVMDVGSVTSAIRSAFSLNETLAADQFYSHRALSSGLFLPQPCGQGCLEGDGNVMGLDPAKTTAKDPIGNVTRKSTRERQQSVLLKGHVLG